VNRYLSTLCDVFSDRQHTNFRVRITLQLLVGQSVGQQSVCLGVELRPGLTTAFWL